MRFFTLISVAVLLLLTAPAIGQTNSNRELKNFGEEELTLLAGDEDLDALTMDLLEMDLDLFDNESRDLARETAQATLLRDHIQAEITVLNREIMLYQDQLERLAEDMEHYENLIDELGRNNERLLAENDALSADQRNMEEEDRQIVAQNGQLIQQNEDKILNYDVLVNDYNYQTVELEDLIEENEETILRQMELLEVCEDMIQTNEFMMQPSGK